MKHLLAITIALLPSPVFAQQFTPQQMLDVMTKSPSNRDVRVHDSLKIGFGVECTRQDLDHWNAQGENEYDLGNCLEGMGPVPIRITPPRITVKPPSGWNEPGVFNHNHPKSRFR